MSEDEIAEFFLQQKKRMDIPEEDITSYVARRAMLRCNNSSLKRGKRRIDGARDEVARKKPKASGHMTELSSKDSSVDTSTRPQLPVRPPCTANAQQERLTVESNMHESMYTNFPAFDGVGIGANTIIPSAKQTAPFVEMPLLSPPSDSNTNPEPPVDPDINASSIIQQSTLSPQRDFPPAPACMEPSSSIASADQTSRSGLRRQKSVSIVSHQRASKRSARRDNPTIKTVLEKAPCIAAAADTSNITTPASTPIDVSKRQNTTHVAALSSTAETQASRGILAAEKKISGESGRRPLTSKSVPQVRRPAKKQAKEKPPMVTPTEYAEILAAKYSDHTRKVRKNVNQFLQGKHIFYTEGDLNFAGESTRGKMEIIVKHGGTLEAKYDPDKVTHIVTRASERATAEALGLNSIMEIPMHIPTVKWSWIDSGNKQVRRKLRGPSVAVKEKSLVRLAPAYLHYAFPQRFDAGDFPGGWRDSTGAQKGKGKAKSNGNDPEDSRISEFTADLNDSDYNTDDSDILLPFPSQATSKKNRSQDDPLAEFYAQAKADVEWGMDESDIEDDRQNKAYSSACTGSGTTISGWTCDKKGGILKGPCPNQDIVDKLTELQGLHKAKPGEENSWRVFSYSKSIRAITNYPTRIKSEAEACVINGVGEKTARKIMEIIRTGELRRIQYENTEDVKVIKLFQGIFGVGMKTAYNWYTNGARTLEDVVTGKGGIKITGQQEIGIRFYDDINERMPRSEAEEIFRKIEKIALQIDPKLFIKIMGSFRRGAETCGDIDILITRPVYDGKTHAGIVRKIWLECHSQGILTEDLVMPDDFNGLELIYRGLCRRDENGTRRRIDFLSVPWGARGAALLYYTGDAIFNRSMRLKARRNGMSLNQRGLFEGVVRSVHNQALKTCEGRLLAAETEEEIFKILNVPWQEPHERVRGDVV